MSVNMNPNALRLLGMSSKDVDKLFTSFGVKSPNYSIKSTAYFPTKIEPTMSDDEYMETIREQAKKDALSGAGYLNSKESLSLKWEYEAVGAPDRKKNIESTLKKMSQNTLLKNSKLEFASFKDSSGNEVASYSKYGGWFAIGTNEEFARASKFNSIYRQSYLEAYNQNSNSLLDKSI